MEKRDIEYAVAMMLGDLLLDGKITAIGTSSDGRYIEDSRMVYPLADQLVGKELYIHTSAIASASDLFSTITKFIPGSNAASLTPDFSPAVPTVADRYFIYNRFRHDDYGFAINQALRQLRHTTLLPMMATMELVGTQFEYAVPSGFKYLNSIYLVPSGSTDYQDWWDSYRLPRNSWEVRANPAGSMTLVFDPAYIDLDDYDEELVHVLGQRRPAELPDYNSETDSHQDYENYITNKAASLLAITKLRESQDWVALFSATNMEAMRLERRLTSRVEPDSVLVGAD